MKKLLFLTAIAVLTFNSSIAQEDTSSDEGISFGVKVGGILSGLTKNDNIFPLASYNIGAVVNIGISEKFSIQPEVVYSAQGTEFSFLILSFGVLKLDYINIPVMASFELLKGLTIQAGPQIGFNLSAKYQKTNSQNWNDVKDDIESTDYGVAFGIQYEFHFGMFFQARYAMGLSDVFSSYTEITALGVDTSYFSGDPNSKVLSLSVGFLF